MSVMRKKAMTWKGCGVVGVDVGGCGGGFIGV